MQNRIGSELGRPPHGDGQFSKRPLKTPRAAAIAGILFSLLMMTSLILLRLAASPSEFATGDWIESGAKRVHIALNLIPFAGVAFLWFIGVLRDRLGSREDRFFATVFLGSGLLFLSLLFVSASVLGAVLLTFREQSTAANSLPTFMLGGALSVTLMNIYTMKMAAVFMVSTSTITIVTGFAARWIAYTGYALAMVLLFGTALSQWTVLVFPVWVLALSLQILWDELF